MYLERRVICVLLKVFHFIILIFITTTITTSADVYQKTNTSSLKISDENSLGELWITYYPAGKKEIHYEPIPYYDYFFPEDENGCVYPNFTLYVHHRLGSPKKDFLLSWIWPDNFIFTCNDIWVSYNGLDIIFDETKTVCNTTYFVEYNISLTTNNCLPTNNATLKCLLRITFYPIYTPVPFIQNICKVLFPHTVVTTDIFIHPT